MNEKKIRAVLFDMDGVLIEAKDWHYEALNTALTLFGMSISRYDHLITFDGLPTRKKLEMLSLERGLPRELHEFLNEMKQTYTIQMVYEKCRPQFAQERALSALKARGYQLAVCSNSVRNSVEVMMERAALTRYLDLMVSNEDVKVGKPDPEMYLKAMSHFNLSPDECLIVEDNENGIRAAKASGAHLLTVKEVGDTNLENILRRIATIESGETA
ncbi:MULTISPECIES: HAD family hydrolase [Paraburkholderia]|uniref:HAD family phosphatase n=1 Tax=Paraburkholderia podalyriae TaxID=1938811 RepID=A0ABR7PYT3_9BURK|nr:HAD family phosphatase [Paraburkholderia podalyriae]MBC8751450.1 HAD family phosphatase [Paraburkholderia podalyriae]